MATMLDRLRSEPTSDFATDGGSIEPEFFEVYLPLYAAGLISATVIKTWYQMTTAQGNQLDAILATQPSTGLLATLLNAKAVSQWPQKVAYILRCAYHAAPPFTTDAAVKTALGI